MSPGYTLDPRVHLLRKKLFAKNMDCRVKPGNDGGEIASANCASIRPGTALVL
jgi:hypothetical protein